MTTQKNTVNQGASQDETSSSHPKSDTDIDNFIRLYNARAAFFADSFIKKLKDGNRRALAELQRFPMQPTYMDLRQAFAKCIQANIADNHSFSMADGKQYSMQELKRLVPQWAAIAERALMDSDPALADKLMSPTQWNAKSAFEVTFVSAMNELKDIKKVSEAPADFEHYLKWVVNPLRKAIEQVRAVNPPANALIGDGDRIPLSEALRIAEDLPNEIKRALADKSK
jgi:hypothetical protein